MPNSFLDLDYIIAINEKRLEQYDAAYHKVLDKFTSLIIIYSALTIFLIPLLQDVIFHEVAGGFFAFWLELYGGLFLVSVAFAVRLLIKRNIAYLKKPSVYYTDLRTRYQQQQPTTSEEGINKLIQASYIDELEIAIQQNEAVLGLKAYFYYMALVFGLLSAVPYMVCLGYHVFKKDDKVQKVLLVNPGIDSTLHKIDSSHMRLIDILTRKMQDSASRDTATRVIKQGATNMGTFMQSPKRGRSAYAAAKAHGFKGRLKNVSPTRLKLMDKIFADLPFVNPELAAKMKGAAKATVVLVDGEAASIGQEQRTYVASRLPGVADNQIIRSSPIIAKEFSNRSGSK